MCQHLGTVLFYTSFGAYTAAMPRKLVWIENKNFQGFGCSECNWMFRPSHALVGESLDEMKEKYEAQRDKEFAAHDCVKHPRATRLKTEWVAAVIKDNTSTSTNMRYEEWIKTLEDGRKVKFIYQELLEDGALLTAQLAGNEVVYSVVLTKARNPLGREDVESHFKGELSKK
jgi:hypothetical protein